MSEPNERDKRKSEIQEQTYHSENGRRMLTFSFFDQSFHISHAYWTKNKKAIIGDMQFTLTTEEAIRTARLILDRYEKPPPPEALEDSGPPQLDPYTEGYEDAAAGKPNKLVPGATYPHVDGQDEALETIKVIREHLGNVGRCRDSRDLDMRDSELRTISARLDQLSTAIHRRPSAPAVDEPLLAHGMDQPWPMRDCIAKLCEAADILLHQKDYDGHGHEEIATARNTALAYLAARPSTQGSRKCLGNECPDFECEACTEAKGRPSAQGEDDAPTVSTVDPYESGLYNIGMAADLKTDLTLDWEEADALRARLAAAGASARGLREAVVLADELLKQAAKDAGDGTDTGCPFDCHGNDCENCLPARTIKAVSAALERSKEGTR